MRTKTYSCPANRQARRGCCVETLLHCGGSARLGVGPSGVSNTPSLAQRKRRHVVTITASRFHQ
jgi:hypothetical protein